MTEEDAKKVTITGGKAAIHIAVKIGKCIKEKNEKLAAHIIGKGLEQFNNRTRVYQGPNALKNFLQYDKGSHLPIGRIDVDQTDFKEFAKTCKKNGVDFAIVKDKVDDSVLHFFFAGKNAEVMSHLFEDYARNKYQQDIKNEMMPEAEDRDIEKEVDREAPEKPDRAKSPEKADKEKDAAKDNLKKSSLKPEKDIENTENTPRDFDLDKEEKVTEKIEEKIDEFLDDLEMPEMER